MLSKILTSYTYDVNKISEKFTHSTILEIVWTLIPAAILLVIAVPSFALLYSIDEMIDPSTTLKVVGHQWYWSYEYSDYRSEEHTSELQSLMRISYAVFCLKKKKKNNK